MESIRAQTVESLPGDLASVLKRIGMVRPLIAANAEPAEHDRHVVDESIEALVDVGAFRVAVPHRYGGYELGHRAAMEVSREVAIADGGTAWVVAMLTAGAACAARFAERAQDEVFGADPDARVALVDRAAGTARRVAGGYRVAGTWRHDPGAAQAAWAIIPVPLLDEHGAAVGDGHLLVPASDWRLDPDAPAIGLRSSGGGGSLSIDDALVPLHRVLPRVGPDAGADPFGAALPLAMLGPQLGLGWAVLHSVMASAPGKPIPYTAFRQHRDSVAFQLDVARAAMLLDTAELHAARAAGDLDAAARAGRALDGATRARVSADIGWSIDRVTEAVSLLLTAHGSGVFAESNPIQRFWRDQAVAARHGRVAPATAYETYGKALLGVEARPAVSADTPRSPA